MVYRGDGPGSWNCDCATSSVSGDCRSLLVLPDDPAIVALIVMRGLLQRCGSGERFIVLFEPSEIPSQHEPHHLNGCNGWERVGPRGQFGVWACISFMAGVLDSG